MHARKWERATCAGRGPAAGAVTRATRAAGRRAWRCAGGGRPPNNTGSNSGTVPPGPDSARLPRPRAALRGAG
eukprot:4119607-Alexandrium_andersonii.AAC.1